MIKIEWNEDKNQQLIEQRGVSFNEVAQKIENDEIIEVLPHPNQKYKHQKIIIVLIKNYVHAAPCIIDDQKIFLKTIYPCRYYHKIYNQLSND